VLQHVRPKYACPECMANVVIAERLPEPIEKGLPGPGLMAHVITNKYADHLPLYRRWCPTLTERLAAQTTLATSTHDQSIRQPWLASAPAIAGLRI
jgi:hypothetical protein